MKTKIAIILAATFTLCSAAFAISTNHNHDSVSELIKQDLNMRCTFCKGSGFNGSFNCFFCGGTGRNSSY